MDSPDPSGSVPASLTVDSNVERALGFMKTEGRCSLYIAHTLKAQYFDVLSALLVLFDFCIFWSPGLAESGVLVDIKDDLRRLLGLCGWE